MKLLLAVALAIPVADDGPLIVTPEQIREHVRMQQQEMALKDLAIRELTEQVKARDKKIDQLRDKTNCT